MLQKNIDKEKRKQRPKTWSGLYTRKMPTKKEKLDRIDRKYNKRKETENA